MYIASTDGRWIAEITGNMIVKSGTYINRIITNLYVFDKNTTYNRNELLEATEEQIAHLKQCIAANKYVEYSPVLFNPIIY